MAFASSNSAAVNRPIVQGLFVASCLLSIVSWYTTFEGMRLYLSVWFSVLASIGLQTALVLVAWLIGFSSRRHASHRPPRALDRRLYCYRHRFDRFLLHQPLHLVQRARAPRYHRAQAL